MAIITIEQLLKDRFVSKKENIKISIEGKGEIEVSIPSLSEIQDIKVGAADSVELQKQLVYYQCINPKLSDSKLLDAMGCKNKPYDVVDKCFGEDVRTMLATIIIEHTDKALENKVKLFKEEIDTVKN